MQRRPGKPGPSSFDWCKPTHGDRAMKDAGNGTLSTESENASAGRVVLQPVPDMKTLYANAFYTQYTTDELMITACVSTPMNDENGTLLAVQPQVRLAMTIGNAARLAEALQMALEQYRGQFAVPKDNIN